MDLLIATGSVPLASADLVPTTGTPQYATNGNPATGVAATDAPAYHYNMITAELVGVVKAAGITPSGAVWSQLLASLHSLFGGGGAVTSGAGWQKLPDGLIIQWGVFQTVTGNLDVVNLPVLFPNAMFTVTVTEGAAGGWSNPPIPTLYGAAGEARGTFQISSVTISRTGVPSFGAPLTANWIALGH